jgi:DNA-binding transcriptional MerR regulator
MATQLSSKRASDQPMIPDRLYFKIGDVARICQVETYVLRFWESQFPQLKPNKGGTGQRLYRRRDVETALEIKRLVHGEGYTLAGARQALAQGRKPASRAAATAVKSDQSAESAAAIIGAARNELRAIASMLASPEPQLPRRRPRARGLNDTHNLLFPS